MKNSQRNQYEYATLDRSRPNTSSYYRLQREVKSPTNGGYSGQKTLDYQNNNPWDYSLQSSAENDQIRNKFENLQTISLKNQLLRNRNSRLYQDQTPLKTYNSQFYQSPRGQPGYYYEQQQPTTYSYGYEQPQPYTQQGSYVYQQPIQYANQVFSPPPTQTSFPQQPSSSNLIPNVYAQFPQTPQALPAVQGNQMTYHRAGDSQIACNQHLEQLKPVGFIGQQYGAIGVESGEMLVDVFSDMPKDQCYYCAQQVGIKQFDTEKYLNNDWVRERERIKKDRIKDLKKMDENNSKFEHEWEREIEREVKENYKNFKAIEDNSKNLKAVEETTEVMDNVSVESEITRKPENYVLIPQEIDFQSSILNEGMNKSKKISESRVSSLMKASVFGAKLKEAASNTRFLREKSELADMYNLQEEHLRQFEEIDGIDLEHINDEERRRLLLLYQEMYRQNQQMKLDQSNCQNSFSSLQKFIDDQMREIKKVVIVDGLDQIRVRVNSNSPARNQ